MGERGKKGETGKGETEIERENDERMGVAGVNERGGRYRDRERGGWGKEIRVREVEREGRV